jgi:predicted flap endonuclease-1-like 5' DNA nuclease
MVKKLVRIIGLAAAIGLVLWFTRERLLPAPHVSGEPAPPFRSTPPAPAPAPEAAAAPDDLRAVKGIGPVMAGRPAEQGITTFRALVDADAATLGEALGVGESRISDWTAQARRLLG